MIAVQVLESVPYTNVSYPQKFSNFEVALLWLNGQIWKINNPEIPLKLFTDTYTLDFFKKFDILDTWSTIDVDILDSDIRIDKSVFWSNSKFRIYDIISGPFLFFDCDLLVWDSIKSWNIFDYDLVTSYKEDLSLNCYLDSELFLSEIPININSKWENMPLNASFVYFNNDNFKTRYTEMAIDWMKKCTIYKKNLNKFSVFFIEQRFLSELAKIECIKSKTLLKNYNTIEGWEKNQLINGLWSTDESYNHVFHLGSEKLCFRKETFNQEYVDDFIVYITENCRIKGFESLIPRFLQLAFFDDIK